MIPLFWWRLDGSEHGNFGDEITRLIIEKVFHKKVVWSAPDTCQMIGAGSILAEVFERKGSNKPYVWSSGLINDGSLTIPADAFKFCGVRGKLTLGRIEGASPDQIVLGDAGLLASHLLPLRHRIRPKKKYKIGILPHYSDKDSEFIRAMGHRPDVLIIDATWPCETVIQSIAECDTVISSSLHGLIVADSVGVPNLHVKISDKLKGGTYKFKDYYSAFSDPDRYVHMAPEEIYTLSNTQLRQTILENYHVPQDLEAIKQRLIAAFPL